jgi:CRISPR-associated exonuclease Cas4
MNLDILLLLPIVLILLAAGLLWASRRQWQQLGMPSGQTVYQDTDEQPGDLLLAHAHQLKGKPDFLIKQGGQIIPVEAKTGRTPTQPYYSHIMQLIAYCVLVEAHTGQRPPHGILRYPERQFTVEFTLAREQELRNILSSMRQERRVQEVHRSHTNPNLCAACGFKAQCDERLPEQTGLWT